MRAALYLVCGLVGGLGGALLVHALHDDTPQRAAPRATRRPVSDTALEAVVREEVRRQLARQNPRSEAGSPGEATGGGLPRGTATPETASPAGAERGDPDGKVSRTAQQVVEDLLGKPFGNRESNALFAWLTRNKEQIGDVIKKLQEAVKADPNNAELHVALATAWVAELTNNTNAGPQQGIVWGQAVQSYDTALELNPEHWQARFGKAFGTSMAPEFLGLRPEAIKQFEELKAIQERQPPGPHHIQTYFRLGTLYKDAGNTKKAQELWEEGLKLFPDSEVLKGTLDASTKK